MRILSCLYLLLLTTSCTIEDRIENREDRLLGSWVIDRASYKGDNNLFADNVIADFRGDQLTFYDDYTLLYESGDGFLFDGNWTISALRDRDDDVEFAIDADFFDLNGEPAFQWIGTIDRLTNNNFNVNLSERTGQLRLKWDRF